jgi:hypothetical protein
LPLLACDLGASEPERRSLSFSSRVIELMRHLGDSKRVPTEPPLVFRYSPHFRFDPLWDVQMLQG